MNYIVMKEPAINRKEILRYARVKEETPDISVLLDECIEEAKDCLSFRVGYDILPIKRTEKMLKIGLIDSSSEVLSKALVECDEAVVFAATIGSAFDRLIVRYSKLSPSKTLILQAYGAERAESLCDAFCEMLNTELKKCEKSLKTRVSPGYGDISLSLQNPIFVMLDCERKLGITLNRNLLMSPSKSVTAIAGIKNNT